jgi:phage shock protein C
MVAGVCGGIADYFNLDPTLVRVGYILLTLLTTGFPGILVYIILAFVMPDG